MKRSPLKRKGNTLKRTRLESKGTLKNYQRKQRSVKESEAAGLWRRTVTLGGCLMCHEFPVTDPLTRATYRSELRDIQGHHAIPKTNLKKLGLKDYIWDERNGVALCGYHHPRHTAYKQRLPRRLLPEKVYDFCRELRIEWLLDLEYPVE